MTDLIGSPMDGAGVNTAGWRHDRGLTAGHLDGSHPLDNLICIVLLSVARQKIQHATRVVVRHKTARSVQQIYGSECVTSLNVFDTESNLLSRCFAFKHVQQIND
jgi:hypothetical protein